MITAQRKYELQALIKSLDNTLEEVETENDRININDITIETTELIKDLVANYIRKNSK